MGLTDGGLQHWHGTVAGEDAMVQRTEQWEIKDNKVLTMSVTPQSDYWRISHYGFTVDDAPFYYATYGGEFEVKVKVPENTRSALTRQV